MKSSKAQFFLAGSACLAISFALLIALGGYFRSVESGGSANLSEKRLLSHLQVFHERLKGADSPEEARASVKMLESMAGFSKDSEGSRELKKVYSPVLSVFASKPREAETRFQLSKKRELMETLVNAYRKEVPHGDIRLRAAYLNILFDTQTSLLSETDEAEQVYLKRNRERLDGLRSVISAAADPTLPARVAAIEGIFQSYERGFAEAAKWRGEKVEALAKQEKALPAVAKAIYAGEDSGVDETRRAFLYICFISLVIAAASFLSLYLGYKVIRMRSDLKMDAFVAYLRGFGTERVESDGGLKSLREDEDWAPALVEAERAEEAFLRSCHTLLAIPKSLKSPCIVVGKEKTIRHWNEAAGGLFGLNFGREWGTDDFLKAGNLRPRDGDAEPMLEMIRSSISGLQEDRFELMVRKDQDWAPYELIMSPITTGPLVGGKVFFWREISSEAERVNQSVNAQLTRTRDLVHKVTHHYPADLNPSATDVSAVREMISDLATLKQKNDERELLWKSEAQALIDQVTRQQDVLKKLSNEIGQLRTSQAEAMRLVKDVHGGDEHWHDEVCVIERDLERWMNNRQRLLSEIQQQAGVLDRAKKFEEQLRTATSAVKSDFESFDTDLDELHQFAEAARVHSVNLSLVRDPGYWEYAARSRAFAHELARFTEKAAMIGSRVREFLLSHPGGALAAHLGSQSIDPAVLENIREEQERVSIMFKRWKETGAELLSGGEKAIAMLHDADKNGAAATQLGETSILINEQAKGNLERWN